MRYILLLLVSLSSSIAQAEWDDWSLDDQRMFVASNIAMAADWATTRNMTGRYDEGYYEINRILGPYPSKDRVDLYFAGMLIANYFIADYAGDYRTYYLFIRTGAHGAAAANNINIGLKLRF